MSKGIRNSFKGVFIRAGMAIAVIGAAMLVEFSPASPRQNFLATKQVLSGLPGAVNRPAGLAASPARQLAANYGKLPLGFEANEGQTDGRVKFLSRGRGYSLFLTGNEAVLTLHKAANVSPTFRSARAGLKSGATIPVGKPTTDNGQLTTDSVLRMKLVGANAHAAVAGAEQLPGKSNYFIGNDPKKWRTNVPTYAQVKYQGVYPGVDLVYYGNQGGQLEYDFVVAPGADPSAIALDVAAGLSRHSSSKNGGVTPPLQIAADGDLVIKIGDGDVRLHKPVVYQEQSTVHSPQLTVQDETRRSKLGNRQSAIDNRQFVDGHYVLTADNQIHFAVGAYDHTRPLVIDPSVVYSTYLGGTHYDQANAIAVNSSGVYVTGYTSSSNFPTTAGAYQTENNEVNGYNVFVTELNPAGTALIYSTYLGGSGQDYGTAIALDSSGDAYVTGYTRSGNFPTLHPLSGGGNLLDGAYQEAFVAALNPTGTGLIYSTYLGGTGTSIDGQAYGDTGYGIAVSSAGVFVTGQTYSSNFPTNNPLPGGGSLGVNATANAFVSLLTFDTDGDELRLASSTYLGGNNKDGGFAIAVDSNNNAYVTGVTNSDNFPTTDGAYNTTYPGGIVAFVTKMNWNNPNLTLIYSTFLGVVGNDTGGGIAVDSNNNVYVAGETYSHTFPTTSLGATWPGGETGGFVSVLNAAGSALVYSTYLGGTNSDYATAIALDSSANIYVTGFTSSNNFPVSPNNIAGFSQCCLDTEGELENAFVVELNSSSGFVYGSFLGGNVEDVGTGIAVDSLGNVYVAGYVRGAQLFPGISAGVFQPTYGAGAAGNAFITKISASSAPAVTFTTNPLAFGSVAVNSTSTLSETITNSGSASLDITNFFFSTGSPPFTFASGGTCNTDGQSLNAGASCTVEITFSPTAAGAATGTFTITDNAGGSPQSVSLTGTGTTPVAGVAPSSLTFSSQNVGTTSASQPVTLSNTGTGALTITSIAASANFGETSTGASACGSSVAAGGSCTINVTFTPTATGSLTGTLTITDNSNGVAESTQTVNLSGTGTGAPAVSLSSPTLSFGSQPLSTTSAALTETVTNSGTTNLTITSVTIGGTNPGDFTKSSDNCTVAEDPAPNGTCSVSVTFKPAATGARSATLIFTDNASNSPQSVPISGIGVDFAVASPTGAQTVAQGGSAQFTINVSSLGGGTDSSAVTLACSSLPTGAACAFSTNPVTPGSEGGSSSLTITTGAPAFARMVPPPTGRPPAALPALLVALLLSTLAGWWQVRRQSPRWAAASCLLFGVLLATTFMAGCGTGGFPLAKVGGTPVGTSTITISGTSGSTVHTTTVTLNVTAS